MKCGRSESLIEFERLKKGGCDERPVYNCRVGDWERLNTIRRVRMGEKIHIRTAAIFINGTGRYRAKEIEFHKTPGQHKVWLNAGDIATLRHAYHKNLPVHVFYREHSGNKEYIYLGESTTRMIDEETADYISMIHIRAWFECKSVAGALRLVQTEEGGRWRQTPEDNIFVYG